MLVGCQPFGGWRVLAGGALSGAASGPLVLVLLSALMCGRLCAWA